MVIDAPVETVWKKVSDFNAIADWHPMVESVTSPEEGTRVLKIKGKGEIHVLISTNNKNVINKVMRLPTFYIV